RVQHFVRVGVADSRNDVLVAEHALDLSSPAFQYGGERVDVEGVRQRLGSEGGHARHVGDVLDEVDGEPFLGARLGEVEPGPVVKDKPEGQRALAWLDWLIGYVLAPAQPARPGQVE